MDSTSQPPQYEDVVSETDDKYPQDKKEKSSKGDSDSDVSFEVETNHSHGNKIFTIHAPGMTWELSPPSELQTNITNADGSPAYSSLRRSKKSGDCTLSGSNGAEIISTKYKFGPGRPPELHYSNPVQSSTASTVVKQKWYSKSAHFVTPDGKTFEWKYAKDKATKSNLLILTQKDAADAAFATLVRNEETRSAGASKWTAGNGGQLILSERAELVIDEPLVIATCLVMLKKEVDRRMNEMAAVVAS